MATPEQVGQMLHQLGNLAQAMQSAAAAHQATAAQAQQRVPQQQPHQQRRLIDTKAMKFPIFDGKSCSFDDWSFAFKRSVRASVREVYQLMVQVENGTIVNEDDLDDGSAYDVHGVSAELYDILCQVVQGEALSVMRSVEDMKGFMAWAKIYKKFNPKTLARAIRPIGMVTNPPKVKDLKDAESMLDNWEEQIKILDFVANRSYTQD